MKIINSWYVTPCSLAEVSNVNLNRTALRQIPQGDNMDIHNRENVKRYLMETKRFLNTI
jgi:hypothetical protein